MALRTFIDAIRETLADETGERLEEALIMADVGAHTTAKVVGRLEEEAESGGLEGGEALLQVEGAPVRLVHRSFRFLVRLRLVFDGLVPGLEIVGTFGGVLLGGLLLADDAGRFGLG